ncbi:MAG TPA: methyltransferase domain-containing protein [Flavipsychrobacter sp.]|nr:methyltransferase domain-containing protein [Flavipsychrobacter sp.]
MGNNVKESFKPRWYSVFFNPFYLIRINLYNAIKRNASFIHGCVLDFGCGSKPYVSLFNVEKYIGLDYQTDVSEKNTALAADVFYDGNTIPFDNNFFDSVFSSEVLEHVFNPDEILEEIHRVLKPGGCLMLTCPFFWPEHEQPYDYARYSSFGIQHLMQKHGFRVVKYEKTGSYFESLVQGMVLYAYYFVPHKPKFLEVIIFSIFITPFLLFNMLLIKVLPKRIKRSDLYLNNIVLAEKI